MFCSYIYIKHQSILYCAKFGTYRSITHMYMFKKKMPKNPWRWIQVNISIILSHKYPYVHILMTFFNLLKCTFFQIFFQFISFLTPGVIYRCDMTKDTYTPTVSSTGSFTQFPSMFRLFHWLLMDHFHCFLYHWYTGIWIEHKF